MGTSSIDVRAAIYLRVSLDATGERLAVDRQRADCVSIVEQRSWDLVGEFVDNSISASDARKNRPGYDDLVRAWDAGEFDALVCWDLDRLTRQPRQLEDWIDRAESRGLSLVTANGEADLSTDGGRLFARVKAAVARSEVERKSERQRAAAQQRSALGRPPMGVRLTGYTTRGDVVPAEATLVERIFQLFIAGESLRSIARTLNAEQISTRHERPWNPSTVRGILTNPRYAGRAVYQGQETGGPGSWSPLVDDDTFNLVAAKLDDPRRRTQVGTDRRHLGSGLYQCTCGEPVRGWSGQRYRCRRGCYSRSMKPVDAFVRAVMLERLSRPDAAQLLARSEPDTAPVLAEVKRLNHRLDTIGADYDAGHIDGARYAVASEKVRAELASARAKLAAISSAAPLAADDPAHAFEDASLMGQRAAIAALCAVRLLPAPQGRRGFDPESVEIEWR